MEHKSEMKKMFDQGTLARSVIESEVSMKKCKLYSELAQDKDVRSFFEDQADALDGVTGYLKSYLADFT
jgi:hypothetical protein